MKMFNRILLLIIIIEILFIAHLLTGCTYTRTAPLFQTSIEANGNTVPVHAAP